MADNKQNFDYRKDSIVAKLVSAYEEAKGIKENERFTDWFGDLALHTVKDGVSQEAFNARTELALSALGISNLERYFRSLYAQRRSQEMIRDIKKGDIKKGKLSLAERVVKFYKINSLYLLKYRDRADTMNDEAVIKTAEADLKSRESVLELLDELNHVLENEENEEYELGDLEKEEINSLIDEVTRLIHEIPMTIDMTVDETLSPKEQLRQRLENGVRSVLDSENFKNWLNTGSQLFNRGYSLNNAILIWAQNNTASYVMSYEKWKDFGRNVAQGAKGIKIYVPIIANEKFKGGLFKSIRTALEGQLNQDSTLTEATYRLGTSKYEFTMNRANKLIGLKYGGKESQIFGSYDEAKRFVDRYIIGKIPVGFTVGTVFDVGDTIVPQYIWTKKFNKSEIAPDENGNPVRNKKGETRIFNTPERRAKFQTRLDMNIPSREPEKMEILFGALSSLSARKGVPVSVINEIDDKTLSDGASGYFSRQFTDETPNGYIVIKNELSPTEKCSVLLHEMGHADLHRDLRALAQEMGEKTISREMREVQAEAVAYATASAFGIETDTSSFAYLAVYSRGFELQDFQKSLDVIFNESKKLSLEIEAELNARGFDMELNPLQGELFENEQLQALSKKYLDFETEISAEIQAVWKDFPDLLRESANNPERIDVLRYQKEIIDSQKSDLESVLNLIVDLNKATTRAEQDVIIEKLDSAVARINEQKEKFNNLSEQYISLTNSNDLFSSFKKEPLVTLETMKIAYPALSELSNAQLQYLAQSKYVADVLAKTLKTNPQEFAERASERAQLISKVASKNGTFVEVSACEQWTDEPLFVGGTLCSPKNAENLITGYEAQIQGFKNEAKERGEYFPYSKCFLSVYSPTKNGDLGVIETRLDIGDGGQDGLKDHLESLSLSGGKLEVFKNFVMGLSERADKRKIAVQDLSKKPVVEPKEQKGATLDSWRGKIDEKREADKAQQLNAILNAMLEKMTGVKSASDSKAQQDVDISD